MLAEDEITIGERGCGATPAPTWARNADPPPEHCPHLPGALPTGGVAEQPVQFGAHRIVRRSLRLDQAPLQLPRVRMEDALLSSSPSIFQHVSDPALLAPHDHLFVDGNKRVAFTIAGVFLELNGFRLEAPEAKTVTAVLSLITGGLDEAGFAEWLRRSSKKMPRRKKLQDLLDRAVAQLQTGWPTPNDPHFGRTRASRRII